MRWPLWIFMAIGMGAMGATGCASRGSDRRREPDAHTAGRTADALDAAPTGASADAKSHGGQPEMSVAAQAVGQVEVRVRWPTAPAAWVAAGPMDEARRCGEPAAPLLKLSASYGVEDAFVVLASAAAGAETSAGVETGETRMLLGACDASPSAIVGAVGDLLLYNRGAARNIALFASPLQWPPRFGAALARGKLGEGELVVASLPDPGVYALQIGAAPASEAFVVVPGAGQRAAVTDERGVAQFAKVPPGTYRATVWWPARSSAIQQLASSSLEVTPGAPAVTTLTLGASR